MNESEREEALRLLLEQLKADGGRYLLNVGLSREERDREQAPTYGGKATHRWLSDDEYAGLIDCLARQSTPQTLSDEARLIALNELYEFQEATGCDTAEQYRAKSAPQQEPVAWIADIAGYADHRKVRCIVFSKDELTYIKDGVTVWTPVYAAPPAAPDADSIFAAIQHGDERHRAWLKDALQAHFDGRPVPPPNIPAAPDVVGGVLSEENIEKLWAESCRQTKYKAYKYFAHLIQSAIGKPDVVRDALLKPSE